MVAKNSGAAAQPRLPGRLGYAYSAHGLTGNLGWAAAPLFFATMTSLYDWRIAYFTAAALYAAILLLLVSQRDKLSSTVVARRKDDGSAHDLAFMKLPVIWWCFGFFLLSTMTFAVVQSFAVSLLKAMHGVSFEAATMTLTAYSLSGALGMLCGGVVATRTANSDKVVASCMSAAAVLLALCGTALLGGTGTMMVLAATGFAIGIGGPSRDIDRKSTRLNSSHLRLSRMPSSA